MRVRAHLDQDTPAPSASSILSIVRDARLVAGVLAASLAYAIVRYNVFGAVSYEHIPVYVANKALSFSSLVLLGLSRLTPDKPRRKHLGLVGLGLALLHVLLSLLVLDPAYLPKHYVAGGRMQWNAELSMLAGSLSTIALLWLAYETATRPLQQQPVGSSLLPGLGRAALALVGVHTLLLGYGVWLDVGGWPAGMPPITMASFALATVFCLKRRSGS